MESGKTRLSVGRNRSRQADSDSVAKTYLIGILFVLLGLAPIGHAYDADGDTKEKEKMEATKKNTPASVNRRADAPSPAGIKTATFALG